MRVLGSSVPEAVRFSITLAFEILRNFWNPLEPCWERVKTKFFNVSMLFVALSLLALSPTSLWSAILRLLVLCFLSLSFLPLALCCSLSPASKSHLWSVGGGSRLVVLLLGGYGCIFCILSHWTFRHVQVLIKLIILKRFEFFLIILYFSFILIEK